MVVPGRPQMTVRRMCTACLIPKSTNTHSEYVVLTAFPLQQLLSQRALTSRYTYSVCLVLRTRTAKEERSVAGVAFCKIRVDR